MRTPVPPIMPYSCATTSHRGLARYTNNANVTSGRRWHCECYYLKFGLGKVTPPQRTEMRAFIMVFWAWDTNARRMYTWVEKNGKSAKARNYIRILCYRKLLPLLLIMTLSMPLFLLLILTTEHRCSSWELWDDATRLEICTLMPSEFLHKPMPLS